MQNYPQISKEGPYTPSPMEDTRQNCKQSCDSDTVLLIKGCSTIISLTRE